jgi:putative hemolysin
MGPQNHFRSGSNETYHTDSSLPATGHDLFDTNHPSAGIRLLQRWACLPELERIYAMADRAGEKEPFFEALLRILGVKWDISGPDLARIPRTGGVIVVANHPFGLIEAVVMGAVLERLRPDVKSMANSLLDRFPKVAERIISVDPFGGSEASRSNRQGLRQSLGWLKQGGMLVVFPAGEVASFDVRRRMVVDPPWSRTVARLAILAKVPVLPMFFEGRNGLAFQMAGLVHPRLRTALLPREFLNKSGKTLVVRSGNPVSTKKLESIETDKDRIAYLRRKTYVLANRQKPKPPLPFLMIGRIGKGHAPKGAMEPVVDATEPSHMEAEIAALSPEAFLDQQGDTAVYIAESNRIPNVVREIGRLRELTFRETGEGTGKSIDLDEFDTYYLHLFIWNRVTKEVVGAYRLGQSDLILRNFGVRGFYTRTLFDYRRNFLERIDPAIEMGRSFVRHEYQKSYAPLLLLWRGIGAFVQRYPHYKVLFGPVSISNDYHPNSRQLMVHFLKEYCRAEDLARFVRARSPLRTRPIRGWDVGLENGIAWDIEDLSAFIADIETDQKGVPILLRQYLRLGGKLLGFNLDANFSNALDGLIVVDLVKTDPKILERYMGKSGAEAFLQYHTGKVAQAR